MSKQIFTIGHSTHPLEQVVGLLTLYAISAIADVRTQPYSRLNPQFNRESLSERLSANGIQYVYLGKELGARPEDMTCYEHGRVSYKKLSRTDMFESGINRIKKGAIQYRLALFCAEKDPLQCHRSILISRRLVQDGFEVVHILENGLLETQAASLSRLKAELGIGDKDFFAATDDTEDTAYVAQEEKIAFKLGNAQSK